MKIKKYILEIHDTYLPKVQYMIDVINSCETVDQLDSCKWWTKELMDSFRNINIHYTIFNEFKDRNIKEEFDKLESILAEFYNKKLYSLLKDKVFYSWYKY